ncbi:MAG: L,D-transpeptidase, partial [Pseudomonadota bacterium]
MFFSKKRSWNVLMLAGAVLAGTAFFSGPATAGQVAPPPLVLSPNLTEPWMMQLQPGAVRRAAPAQRRQVQQPQVRRANWWSRRMEPAR